MTRLAHRSPRPFLLLAVLALVALLAPPASASGSDDPVGVWPLQPEPEVVRRFDPFALPYGAGHRGVDLAGRPGQPVRAALPGRVAYAGRIAGRGIVVVSHGPTRTTYEPVTATVAVGADLAAGTPLGRLEIAGSHCFPRACLHWGWIAGDVYLDPLRLVGGGPVRLLPLAGLPRVRASPSPPSLGSAARLGARAFRPGDAPAGTPGAAGRW